MPRDADFAARILLEDEHLLVVDKPAGLLTVGHADAKGRCVLDELRAAGRPVAPVHRLDRETSGALLLSRAPHSHRAALEDAFREHAVAKHYLALVLGRPQSKRARIELPIHDEGKTARVDRRGRPAVTHYELLHAADGWSLLRCTLETGRHNQIRVHLAHLGHPLVGDRKFAHGDPRLAKLPAPRCLLHAEQLGFTHPATGARVKVRAPVPDDMRALLDAAGVPHELPPPRDLPTSPTPAPRRGAQRNAAGRTAAGGKRVSRGRGSARRPTSRGPGRRSRRR